MSSTGGSGADIGCRSYINAMQEHAPRRTLAFSYVRMSTAQQLLGHSLQRQVERSREYATAHGLELVEDYHDLGVSAFKGRNIVEGRLGAFLDAVKAGKVPRGSFLLIENLDRLSRQEVHISLRLFLDILTSRNHSWHSRSLISFRWSIRRHQSASNLNVNLTPCVGSLRQTRNEWRRHTNCSIPRRTSSGSSCANLNKNAHGSMLDRRERARTQRNSIKRH